MSPRVVLVGAPGSGKSTVGAALAAELGVAFRDTDTDVETAAGRTVAELFVAEGEPAFRVRERAAVVAALREHDGVLALGGGAVLDPATRADLAPHPVVWLKVSAGVAGSRVGLGVSRPVLLGNVRSRLVTLLAERTPLYEQVADVVVDTDGRELPDIVADAVTGLARLGPRAPAPDAAS